MKNEIYRREGGLDRVWQHEIMPLLEDLFYSQRDLTEHYGLDSLRKALASSWPSSSWTNSASPRSCR